MADKYPSMTKLYEDPANVEGATYGKRWRRHEWIQLAEAQATDNPEGQKIVLAVHGGDIEGATSEIALAVAGYHPATFAQATDCYGLHDLWIFEGLLNPDDSNRRNSELHVTSTHYDDPIALKLVEASRRCLSLHGLRDARAHGKIQIGGLDTEPKKYRLGGTDSSGDTCCDRYRPERGCQ
jgi:hypothetical protein